MSQTELSFETTDDLLEELLHRFDHAIFAGMNYVDDDGTHKCQRRWRGNSFTCAGLASDMNLVVLHEYHEECELPVDDDAPEED